MSNALSAEYVIRLYTIEHITAYEIAKHCKRAYPTIRKILSDNNITIKGAHKQFRSDRFIIDATELNRLYTIEHLPSTEIAKRFGVTNPTILRRLQENHIPIRPKHGNPFNKKRIQASELPPLIKEPTVVKQSLTGIVTCPSCGKSRRLYLNRLRVADIIKANGKCRSCATIARAIPLDHAQIKHLYEHEHLSTNDIASRYKVSPHVIIRNLRLNNSYIRPKEKTLELKFQKTIQNNGTLESPMLGDIRNGTEIGLKNCSYYVWIECQQCKGQRWEVKSRIKKHPICKPCSMILNGLNHRGENASGWLGGISFEPYGITFNKTLREQIRRRDNYTCQLCGAPMNGNGLACHHIDYDKKCSHPNNLISLCPRSCHLKTNHNREYWTAYFNNLLKERGVLLPTS